MAWSGFEGFWACAATAADLPSSVPADRWDVERAYSPEAPPVSRMSSYARFGAFVPGAAHFDAAAFRLAPNEASALDPQQRLLLEEVGAALTDAGNAAGQQVGSFTGNAPCLPSSTLHVIVRSETCRTFLS